MENFFAAICPAMLWVFAVVEFAFICIFALRFVKGKKWEELLCALLSFGLFYDSLMLAFGTFLKAGDVFQAFSQVRFIVHGALIPLLFAITYFHLNLGKVWKIILLSVTGVLIVAGIAQGFATVLEVKEVSGVVRYASSKELTPGWAEGIHSVLSYGAVVPLIAGGIYDIIKNKKAYFLLSGILMFVFAAIGPALAKNYTFFISMFGEFFMMLFLLLANMKKPASK